MLWFALKINSVCRKDIRLPVHIELALTFYPFNYIRAFLSKSSWDAILTAKNYALHLIFFGLAIAHSGNGYLNHTFFQAFFAVNIQKMNRCFFSWSSSGIVSKLAILCNVKQAQPIMTSQRFRILSSAYIFCMLIQIRSTVMWRNVCK